MATATPSEQRVRVRRAGLAAAGVLIVGVATIVAVAPVIGAVPTAVAAVLLVVLYVADRVLARQALAAEHAAELQKEAERADAREREAQEAARARERAARNALRIPVARVSDVSPESVGVDPVDPRVLDEALSTEGSQLRYATRDVDGRLRAWLARARDGDWPPLVCLNGPSKSGKSRTMFEAVRAALPQAALVAPRSREGLETVIEQDVLMSSASQYGSVVLWLDDLEGFVRLTDSGLDKSLVDELKRLIPSLVIAATVGGRGVDAQADFGPQLYEPLRALMTAGITEQLPAELGSEAERRALADVVPAALATDMEAGIGAVAVSGAALIDVLVSERNVRVDGGRPCPEGAALAWAAITAYRLGVVEPLGTSLLRELFACYFTVATSERFDRAVSWATTPLYGDIALLRGSDSALAPFDYLVQHTEPRELTADRCVWSSLLSAGRPGDALLLGLAAANRGATDDAIEAFRSADALGEAAAANNLGALLERRGDMDEAMVAYRRADRRGHARAAVNFGYLLKTRGEFRRAEAAYLRAEKRGESAGPYNLGRMRLENEDRMGAKDAWSRAAALGGYPGGLAACLLGSLLYQEGDITGAERAWRRADELGELDGTISLGTLLENQGDHSTAKELYTRAAEMGGDDGARAARCLGRLLKHEGDLDGAERAYAWSDDLGSAAGALNYGVLLKQRGENEAAHAAILRAANRGDHDAIAYLLGLPTPSSQPDDSVPQ